MEWKEEDLGKMLETVENIVEETKNKIKGIYSKHNLNFPDKSRREDEKFLRAIIGDIHTKVLGRYLRKVLAVQPQCEPQYETPIIPKRRFRADIQIQNIFIEVKSHGMFHMATTKQRFETLKKGNKELRKEGKPEATHVWVAFREREDYIEKTNKILKKIGVETFFFSSYERERDRPNPNPEELKKLVDFIKNELNQ